MKLMGSPNQRKKDGSNNNSSRTSPSRMEDSEFVNNSLLASTTDEDFDSEVHSLEASTVTNCSQSVSNPPHSFKENGDESSRSGSVNSCAIHPMKSMEDENLDYDSNASSSSFEFHKGETQRAAARSLNRSFSRPTSYKWNDAEKWIANMSKQVPQCNHPKGHNMQPQSNRIAVLNMSRVSPATQMSLEKYSLPQSNLFPHTKDLKEIVPTKTLSDDNNDSDNPALREVSMRDMGTEMTPIPSQEPSRTATPIGATTPHRTPTSSLPSTPRRAENGNRDLSEEEMKLKTRREIVALGVKLGKMNIAAWASKDEQETSVRGGLADPKDMDCIEYEQRAAAWAEAENSKHAARFKREEIKIQAWESEQKAKLEEEMRRIEARVEEMRTEGQAKMMKKIAMARKRSDERRMAAEAKKNRQAERTEAQAECIRQTGRIPSSDYSCCGLF
ncbi:hypothetical protein V2J09_018647 [Rumex salicifolius]